jgi:hypothetical protein
MDLCSMKVSIGTFQTGPRRKPTKLSKTHASSSSLAAPAAAGVDFLLDISLVFWPWVWRNCEREKREGCSSQINVTD